MQMQSVWDLPSEALTLFGEWETGSGSSRFSGIFSSLPDHSWLLDCCTWSAIWDALEKQPTMKTGTKPNNRLWEDLVLKATIYKCCLTWVSFMHSTEIRGS